MSYKDKMREMLVVDIMDSNIISAENDFSEFTGTNTKNVEDLPSVDEAWDEAYKIIESQLTEDEIDEYLELTSKVLPILNEALDHFRKLRIIFDDTNDTKGTLQ